MDLNLLISSDARYLPHAVTALTSACESNRRHRIRIFCLHAGLGERDMRRIRAHFARYEASVNFIRADGTRLSRYHTPAHVALPSYFRILCADLLPAGIDRVLYLDCDVIVRAALDELYSIDLGNCTVAAVRDAYLNGAPWRARLNALAGADVRTHFNAGVMLIDVARYRSTGVGPAALGLLDRFHREFIYADQDALNVALAGKWKVLAAKWNVQSHWYTPGFILRSAALPPDRRNRYAAAIRNPAIIHYSTQSKPWQFMNSHPWKQEYWNYRNLTPFASLREETPRPPVRA